MEFDGAPDDAAEVLDPFNSCVRFIGDSSMPDTGRGTRCWDLMARRKGSDERKRRGLSRTYAVDMPSEFDTSDPLGALMAEWRQTNNIFWAGAVATGILIFTPFSKLAWLLGLVLLGMIQLMLGQSVVIVGNELRKAKSAAPHPPDEAR